MLKIQTKPNRRQFNHHMVATIAASALAATPILGAAQDKASGFPSKPIRILISIPPGGKMDVLTRGMAAAVKGSLRHFVLELLERSVGIKFNHIPYRGATQAMQDLLGGQVKLFIKTAGGVVSPYATKRIKVFATSGAKSTSFCPIFRLMGISINSKNTVRPELVEGLLLGEASTGSARTVIYRSALMWNWVTPALWVRAGSRTLRPKARHAPCSTKLARLLTKPCSRARITNAGAFGQGD